MHVLVLTLVHDVEEIFAQEAGSDAQQDESGCCSGKLDGRVL